MMPFDLLQSILRGLDRLLIYFALRPLGIVTSFRAAHSPLSKPQNNVSFAPILPTTTTTMMRPLDDFRKEVMSLFSAPCNIRRMKFMSSCLRREYLAKLQSSQACMLPSYCHALPTGQETGTFIAMDLGGSTFRVALVELGGRQAADNGMTIKRMCSNKINETIRGYGSEEFFGWMAGKIRDMLQQGNDVHLAQDDVLPIGLAWSFPIEQTSQRGGKIQHMGKGFKCHEGCLGQDLGGLIESACMKQGLRVRVDAIINDSSATLLSQAYRDPATSMGLILGTGTNMAVYLPVFSMGAEKFGVRDPAWYARAEKVIVNTEISMFGKGILPETRWDQALNKAHQTPDYQPLEYMTTGRYLGEILRLIILEAVDACALFDGIMPAPLVPRYSLDTALLAAIEADTSDGLMSSAERLQKEFVLDKLPTRQEMAFLRSVIESISKRAAAYVATAIHALWAVQKETEIRPMSATGSGKTSVAANGSVVTMYPGFKSRCQNYIADLIESDDLGRVVLNKEEVIIESTTEAAIFGAAVAVAISDGT